MFQRKKKGKDDWECGECGLVNYARRKECHQCGAGSWEEDSSSWWCHNCGERHANDTYLKCPKPVAEPSAAAIAAAAAAAHQYEKERNAPVKGRWPKPPTIKPGDWLCPGCNNHNFAMRTKCNRCGKVKPRAPETSEHRDRSRARGGEREERNNRERSRSARRGQSPGRDRGNRREGRAEGRNREPTGSRRGSEFEFRKAKPDDDLQAEEADDEDKDTRCEGCQSMVSFYSMCYSYQLSGKKRKDTRCAKCIKVYQKKVYHDQMLSDLYSILSHVDKFDNWAEDQDILNAMAQLGDAVLKQFQFRIQGGKVRNGNGPQVKLTLKEAYNLGLDAPLILERPSDE